MIKRPTWTVVKSVPLKGQNKMGINNILMYMYIYVNMYVNVHV